MKILIAEDDHLILKTLQICLKNNGFEVIPCMDGLGAMEKIEEENPDLIIVDIMLPYFSGLEVVSKIKYERENVPVIVISAMGQQSIVEEALKLGADEYLPKPFNINSLLAVVKRLTKVAVAA